MGVQWWYEKSDNSATIVLEDGTAITVKVSHRTGEITVTWDGSEPLETDPL
jgi:DNA integrity scanning protein DisA with diadenylate cyclase activity